MAAWGVLDIIAKFLKLQLDTSKINKCESDKEKNGQHLSRELEIFDATGEKTRIMKPFSEDHSHNFCRITAC